VHPAAAKALFEQDVKHLTAALGERRGWTINKVEWPIIDCTFRKDGRTPLRVIFNCENWNDRAPSIELLSEAGVHLTTVQANPSGIFHAGPHHVTNRPFICMRGAHEYHTHPSHVSDTWETVKGKSSYDLGGILTQVWNGWLKGSD
jgi:hypothetical protein